MEARSDVVAEVKADNRESSGKVYDKPRSHRDIRQVI